MGVPPAARRQSRCSIEARPRDSGTRAVRKPRESKMAQATRHVTEGRRIVARQHAMIEGLKKGGRDTSVAEQLLAQFERSLAIFEDDLRLAQAKENPKSGLVLFVQ